MNDHQHDADDDRIGMTQAQIELIADGTCPDCRGTIFRPGPRGGLSQNIECVQCLSRFNVSHHQGRFLMAGRIPSEADGGSVWREDMFPKVLE
jgi:hypothetical protein